MVNINEIKRLVLGFSVYLPCLKGILEEKTKENKGKEIVKVIIN